MNFTEQLNLFLKKRLNSKYIQISEHTPAVLQKIGINDYPILMETRGLKKAFADKGSTGDNYHGLGIEGVSQLPDILNSPAIVLNSLSHPRESVVIVADSLDKNGYPIVLPIKLNQKANYNFVEIDSNIVMTAYGRASFGDFLKDNIAAQTIVFADKEKSQRLLDSGLQLPITFDSATIIRPWNEDVNNLEQRISAMKAHKFTADGVYQQMLTDGMQKLTAKKENMMDETNTTEPNKTIEARAKAQRLVQETGEPYVTIEFSENSAFDSGDVLPLSVADKKLAQLDAEHKGDGYDKVKLHIDYIKDGKPDSYEGCRFDIGDEQQGLVSHIQSFWQFYLDNKNWRKRLESEHSPDYVKSAYEEYEHMAHDVAPFLKRHIELADMIQRAQSVSDFTSEDVASVKSHVAQERAELNGVPAAAENGEYEKKDDVIERVTPKVSTPIDGVDKPQEPAPARYRDKVTEIRDTMIQAILARIEKDPLNWTAGWNKVSGNPVNGKTDTAYRGLNSIYLYLMSEQHGYNDPRWVTFNQAKALGASIKKGEKSYPVLFYERYDKLTKKEYDPKTTKSMTDEERAEYESENVRFVLKYYSVFNAAQCVNFPELDKSALLMSEEERANQNELIEMIIANSAASIFYNGGNQAYYSPDTDSIHLPAIENFHSMQDYYATALHEIAHSTGHKSRLNRGFGEFGNLTEYATEELRAELACVFMQIEHGINIEGQHIVNHAAYVQSWLEAVKSDPTVFYKAVRDAGKIADYVDDNYLQAIVSDAKEEVTEEIKAEERANVNKLEENVREWYTSTFPTDELGADLDGGLSFGDVANALSEGENIYDVLGSDDNIVRERVFGRLAELQDKPYSEIYDAWFDGHGQAINVSEIRADAEARANSLKTARAEAQRLVRETGEPYVTVEWSEGSENFPGLKRNEIMPLSEADKRLALLDLQAEGEAGYYKTKLHIDFVFEGKLDSYNDCRYDIGSEGGGLVHHISENGKYNTFLTEQEKQEINSLVEFFNEHLKIASYKSASEDYSQLSDEEQDDIARYVSLGRSALNESVPFSDYINHMPLTPDVVKEARDAAHAAGLPFSSRPYEGPDDDFDPYVFDGSMSVEDYNLMWEHIEADERKVLGTICGNTPNNKTELSLDWVVLASTVNIDTVREIVERNGGKIKDGNIVITDAMRANYRDMQERELREQSESKAEPKFESQPLDQVEYTEETDELADEIDDYVSSRTVNFNKAQIMLNNYDALQSFEATFLADMDGDSDEFSDALDEESPEIKNKTTNLYNELGYEGFVDLYYSHLKIVMQNDIKTEEEYKQFLIGQFPELQRSESEEREHKEENEYRALKIVLNNARNGEPLTEYITIQGSNYLIKVSDLIMKYGGEEREGNYYITPAVEEKFAELQIKYENGEHKENIKPLYQKYIETQRKYPNAFIFQRVGDFYEVIGETAKEVASRLDLTLMSRDVGLPNRAPMCGVPYHAIDVYATKLREFGDVVIEREEGRFEELQQHVETVENLQNSGQLEGQTSIFELPQEQGEHKEGNSSDGQPENDVQSNISAGQAQERKREWFTVDLPEGSLGKRYGENVMVRMPAGEYSYYALFIPAKLVKTAEGKSSMRIASDFTYRLNNDGRQVELTGLELRDSLAGMQIGKEYKRVAPSRLYAKTFADLERNVPEEMKALPNWCVYRTFQRDDKDKKGKVLKSALTGQGASSQRRGDWTDFHTALKYAKENGFAGVSFLLEAKNGITCVDLDECVLNAQTGEMKERATKLVEALKGTYMERSTSGNGIHIFLKDDILKSGRFRSTSIDATKGDLEVYDDNRVISMTGNMFSEKNELTRAGSAATVYLRAELGEQKHNNNVGAGTRTKPTSSLSLSDNELIGRIRSSKKGRDFDDLYYGKGITGNKSDDDAKLAHLLLYFNEGDKDQAFRIMRESGANRPDKPDSYYRHTIDNMDKNIQEYAKRPSHFSGKGPQNPGGRRGDGKGPGAGV